VNINQKCKAVFKKIKCFSKPTAAVVQLGRTFAHGQMVVGSIPERCQKWKMVPDAFLLCAQHIGISVVSLSSQNSFKNEMDSI